ncbi:putative NADPH-quinone reductase (modulator of drug activity B) [Gynuella sunshinyii YC6258]|uniref:Putative NADPH-quinone reductase (Modulator of drug activity B) n=1 Tax=Gynuella sunshinyii YC6258 TaxID=1445510 RepID=A0A0C5VJA9_9GAMM|nr:putative NADPH-quinone reductase (modulator of drug activity B) [Gynuella sunshinyii YC6258]
MELKEVPVKCLLVLAHPLKGSLCDYLANKTASHLRSKGYNVSLLNLYEREFAPVLTREERQSYYQTQFDETLVQAEIAQLKQAESLVLVFPTWWFGFPAILKGWFDRVWAPGHAYNHASDLGAITPCLNNLKEVKVITTLGSPWWVDKLVLRQPVKRILKIALLGACTKKCKFQMLSFYKSENASPSKVDAFVKKIALKY